MDINESIDGFLQTYEFVEADALFVAAILPTLVFAFIQLHKLRREVRLRRDAEQKAVNMALRDPLTGLGNRRRMEEVFSTLKKGEVRCVVMLDLDGFKSVNDLLGHATGDRMLANAAQRLLWSAGRQSFVCRFGGDEFAVVSGPLTDHAASDEFARSIAAAFDDNSSMNEPEIRVAASVGYTTFKAGSLAAEELIRRADLALFHAKAEPDSPCVCFEPRMDEERRRRQKMEYKLRDAIPKNAVLPYFQPIVDLKSGRLTGFEALARWTDPEFGVVSPAEFIALAEESGLISELSDHLFESACAEAAKWPAQYGVSFNLSPQQLKDKLLGLRIMHTLAKTGLSPSRLTMEITENSLVEDKQQAKILISALADSGIGISIDDFGTGYSSLDHLKEFRFDTLKIDRSFVLGMKPGNKNEVIVNAVLRLSKGLGLKTVAEGIEREDQIQHLIHYGCDTGQGYYFGHAMSAQDAHKLILQQVPFRETDGARTVA